MWRMRACVELWLYVWLELWLDFWLNGAVHVIFSYPVPEWRNGRRGGLKIRCPQGRVGSTPSSGTSTEIAYCAFTLTGQLSLYYPAASLIQSCAAERSR